MKPLDFTRFPLNESDEKWLYSDITREIINAAMEVHSKLGMGFLESVYEEALCYELKLRKINYKRQFELDIHYKGIKIPKTYIPDLIVEDKVIVELKAILDLTRIEEAILINYLKASKLKVGLLLNFGSPSLQVTRRIY